MINPHDSTKRDVHELYEGRGLPKGQSTGWPSVDKLYTVLTSQWTLITGWPNSGKSEWLDALLVNLAKAEPWRFFIYSPENYPLALHHVKLLEKYIGKPFSLGPTERMTEQDVQIGEAWIGEHFLFCQPDTPTIQAIVEEGCSWISHSGRHKTGIVIDPWNQLEHHRPNGLSMTEYVSQALSAVIRLVREYNVHLWLVAHPAKQPRNRDTGKLPVPTPDMVSDSAHFWNKTDNAITVWRDQAEDSTTTELYVQKIKFKHTGRIGKCELRYDRITGRYNEPLRAVPGSIQWTT